MRDPVVGDAIDQYVLTDLLARSGMASIFKATDTATGEPVALKIPHLQYESDVVFYERFRREEEIGQQLDHPNVVKVLKPREKTRMYMAREYVDGKSLRAMMGSKTPVATDRALSIARQVCSALVYLHAKGVVHRDIKPENILVDASGHVKILDFGIALWTAERRLTWAGLSSSVGTPDYMAPEQIRGRRGDPRTDVYAVGTLLYEMLTCNLPYESMSPRALLRAKTHAEARPPSWYVPGFDSSLEAIILKAIEVSPSERYASAKELLADLEHPEAVPPRDPATGAALHRRRRVPRRVALALVVAALLGGLASLVWLSSRYSRPPAPQSAPRQR